MKGIKICHAVTATDITEFMLRHNLSMEEVSDLLAIPKNKLTSVLASEGPVSDVAVALLVRLYSEYPFLIEKFEIQDLYNLMQGDSNQKLRHLSVIFGRDSSASYRWIRKGRPMSGQPLALGRLIGRLPHGIDDLKRVAIKEAEMRGVNPFKTGSWSKPEMINKENISGRTYKPRTERQNLPHDLPDFLRKKISTREKE